MKCYKISEWSPQETLAYNKAREEKRSLIKKLEVEENMNEPQPETSIVKSNCESIGSISTWYD